MSDLKTYVVVKKVHFGPILNRMQKVGKTLQVGETFSSDGERHVEYQGHTYDIPSVAAAIDRGWVEEATTHNQITLAEDDQSSPDADQQLKKRLEEAGMDTVESEDHFAQSDINEIREKPAKKASFLPLDWDVKEHYTARQRKLEQMTNINDLILLYRYYAEKKFQKRVAKRLEELGVENPEVSAMPRDPQNLETESNVNLKRSDESREEGDYKNISGVDGQQIKGRELTTTADLIKATDSESANIGQIEMTSVDADKAGKDASRPIPTSSVRKVEKRKSK